MSQTYSASVCLSLVNTVLGLVLSAVNLPREIGKIHQRFNINNEHCFFMCFHSALSLTFLRVLHLYSKTSKLHSMTVTCYWLHQY